MESYNRGKRPRYRVQQKFSIIKTYKQKLDFISKLNHEDLGKQIDREINLLDYIGNKNTSEITKEEETEVADELSRLKIETLDYVRDIEFDLIERFSSYEKLNSILEDEKRKLIVIHKVYPSLIKKYVSL